MNTNQRVFATALEVQTLFLESLLLQKKNVQFLKEIMKPKNKGFQVFYQRLSLP